MRSAGLAEKAGLSEEIRAAHLVAEAGGSRPIASKSILYVRYFRSGESEYADYVEAKLLEIRFALGQILLGDEAEFFLFGWGDGFGRLSEGCAAPELHFHEDEGFVAAAEDEVYFSVAGLEVSFDEGIAEVFEELQRDPFSALAVGAPAFQPPTPA